MSNIEPRTVCELETVEDKPRFLELLDRQPRGVFMVPERRYGHLVGGDAYDFMKWMRIQHPEIEVGIQQGPTVQLLSTQIWLPLAVLASDVTLSVYLNLVSSFLCDRIKGAMQRKEARVRVCAEYQDPTGVVKRFTYEGDLDGLSSVVRNFDVDKFFEG
jgi:hypothetical protein